MEKSFLRYLKVLPLILALSYSFWCREKTDKELILELMQELGKMAEKKDVKGMIRNLSLDYRDFEGRDIEATEEMLKDYFTRFRGIVINFLGMRVDEIGPSHASLRTEIAVSSGQAKVLRKLIKYSLDNYRIEIKLIKAEKKWLLHRAQWEYVGYEELFPESLEILKMIFPEF